MKTELLKTTNLFFLLGALFVTQAQAGQREITKIGGKVLVHEKQGEITAKFENPALDLFCNRLERFLERYIKDYQENECTHINEHNEIICELIKEGMARNSSGINAFGTDLESKVNIVMRSELSDFNLEERQQIAAINKVELEDVIHTDDLAQYEFQRISLQPIKKGIFSTGMDFANIEARLLSPERLLLRPGSSLRTSERYLACALMNGEVEIEAQVVSEIKVVDPIKRSLLKKLWDIYSKLEQKWREVGTSDKTGLVLIQMGAEMNELEKPFRTIKPDQSEPLLKMESWFDRFFTQELDGEVGLRISMRQFQGLDSFESKLYPPKNYPVVLDKTFNFNFSVGVQQ